MRDNILDEEVMKRRREIRPVAKLHIHKNLFLIITEDLIYAVKKPNLPGHF